MSTSIFMRGDPLDLTQQFYLSYTNSNLTYLYCLNTSDVKYNSVTPIAGFLSMSSSYSKYSAVQFKITSLGDNSYSFQSGDYYLGLNSSNIIDLVSSVSVAIKFSAPSTSTSYNIYNILNSIYPGLPYSNTINGMIYSWYIFNISSSSSDWNSYLVNIKQITPFIFPVNNGQIAVWQVNSSYESGACFYSTTDASIGIEWLYNWSINSGDTASINCDTQGNIDSTYNNCYFSSINSCEAMYSYSLCSGADICGNCLGNTQGSNIPCRYNTPKSYPPLFASSTPVSDESVINSAILLPDTTTEDDTTSGCSTGGIILLFIIFIILIILIIIGIYYGTKNKNKSTSSTNNAKY